MREKRLFVLLGVVILLVGCAKSSEVDDENLKLQTQVAESSKLVKDLNKKLDEKSKNINQLNKELLELKLQISDQKDTYDEQLSLDNMYRYDHEQLVGAFLNSRYIIELYKQEIKNHQGYEPIKLNNIVLPELIEVGDVVADLEVIDQSSNYNGREYLISFFGEFTIDGILEYSGMGDAYFIRTDCLDKIPYVARVYSPGFTSFLIRDLNGVLFEVEDGDKISATFYDYTMARTYGKPMTDMATIKSYKKLNN